MTAVTVFYANQVHEQFEYVEDYRLWRAQLLRTDQGREIYNGAYVFNHRENEWYAMDSTPRLLEQVPKSLRALLLIIT